MKNLPSKRGSRDSRAREHTHEVLQRRGSEAIAGQQRRSRTRILLDRRETGARVGEHIALRVSDAIRFETSPDLISGIELTKNGQKVAWSIADYLVSLEKGVDELLKEKDKPEAIAKTPSDLTPQIAKRAYELYEERGRKDGRAIQDWVQAKQEIRKPEAKAEPKPEDPKPKTKSQ